MISVINLIFFLTKFRINKPGQVKYRVCIFCDYIYIVLRTANRIDIKTTVTT